MTLDVGGGRSLVRPFFETERLELIVWRQVLSGVVVP